MSGTRQDWEQSHTDAYGMSAWRRAVVSCGALVAHHTGYDRHGLRPARPDAPDPAAFGREWMPVVELLALAACRAAWEGGVLVDDVELSQLLGWIDGAHTAQLPAGPLLDSDRAEADWRRLAGDDQCRWRARDVVSAAAALAIAECRELTGARDGTLRGALLLGTRARAVRAQGIPGLEPGWAGDCRWATEQVERLHLAMRSGLWKPSPAHREYARAVHRTLVTEPDHPPPPDGADGPMWIQRIVRFPHVQSTVLALAAQPAYAVVSPASDPLGAAIDAVVHTGMGSVADIADDLEHVWATRPPDQSVTDWEFAHLPRPVREQIRAVEELTLRLTTVLLDLGYSRA
ncbi:hypothetical protein ACFV8E_39655 [Streptomyces sp. NPDC059849]|uniref:hypothetical protein n=1 Tax=Streptomyces sp. NPDC059849 TaxID=3346969 RepID=UPI00364A05C5